jgi:hypothetical protein
MRLVENTKIVIKDALQGTGGLQTAGNGVNMAKYNRCRIILLVACSDAAVAGGEVTLKQGTTATCATALAFTEMWKNEDVLAGDTLTRAAVTSNTFNAGVRNKTAMYIMEVKSDMLDNDTDGSENTYIRLDLANITTATEAHSVVYELYEPRYVAGGEGTPTAW